MPDTTYSQGDLLLTVAVKILEGLNQGGFGPLGTQGMLVTLPASYFNGGSFKVDLSGTGANSTAIKVDGSGFLQPVQILGTVPISGNVGIIGTVPVSGSVSVIGETFVAGALKVDGSAVIQPISGSVGILGTVPVSGTVAVSGTVLTDGSAHTQPISGSVGVLGTVPVSGTVAVSSVAGTVLTDGSAHTQPISGSVGILGTVPVSGTVAVSSVAGTVLTDGSAHTQPVSGTIAVSSVAGTVLTDGSAHTQPVSGTVAVSSVAGTVLTDGSAHTQPISGSVGVLGTVPVSVAGNVTVVQPTGTNLKVDLSGTGANATAIKVDGSAVTQPVSISGTVSVTGPVHAVVKVVPTISTSAYSIGFSLGGIQTITNAVGTKGTGILESLIVFDKANQGKKMDIYIFDATPSGASTTDHAAFAFGTDGFKCLGRVSIVLADWSSLDGTQTLAVKTGLSIAVKAAAGTSLFAVAVIGATGTYTALALQFVWGIKQD
jgi:hypothetical protein